MENILVQFTPQLCLDAAKITNDLPSLQVAGIVTATTTV
jgi:hypothetical protein